MITINSSTNYLSISNSVNGDVQVIQKAAISTVDLKNDHINIKIIGQERPEAVIHFDDVVSPVAADIQALHTTILGYL